MTVKVFITNVNKPKYANALLAKIHKSFGGFRANFYLDDCDNILRVQFNKGVILSSLQPL